MKTSGFWLILASIVVTPVALLLGIGSAGAGHGDYFLAKILFPYTMLSTSLLQSITAPFIVLAILQFPLYGLILAYAGERKRLGSFAIVLAVVHILATGLCLMLKNENFS